MYADVETIWRTTIAANPGLLDGPRQPGRVLWARAGCQTPSPIISRHWKTDRTTRKIHYNLGNAFAGRSQFDRARAEFAAGLSLKPDYVQAHDNLAAALTRLGRPEEAMAHYQQALKIQPDFR